MKSFLEELEKKIKQNINVNKLEILDNTSKHKSHKSFEKNKLHLTLIIESDELKGLERIEAHKKIMSLLSNELKNKIHALEIKIK